MENGFHCIHWSLILDFIGCVAANPNNDAHCSMQTHIIHNLMHLIVKTRSYSHSRNEWINDSKNKSSRQLYRKHSKQQTQIHEHIKRTQSARYHLISQLELKTRDSMKLIHLFHAWFVPMLITVNETNAYG